MGDRASIQFKNGEDTSVVLFSHWGGRSFALAAQEYATKLKENLHRRNMKGICPIDRMEPQTVMVDFIRWLTKDMKLVESDLYLGKDELDGDNSDNGHFVIDLRKR
jgi:hypothetical protein